MSFWRQEFPPPSDRHLAENTTERVREPARLLGFEQSTGDWKEAGDRADAVIVAAPSVLHAPVGKDS